MGFSKKFAKIADRFQTLSQLQDGLRECGLESSNLIIAIDYTKSNTWTGKVSFGSFCLHHLSTTLNPYQQVISILGRTLEVFDDDHLIPAFGFGDVTTTDKSCFPFFPDNRSCNGFAEVLTRYSEITQHIELSGPTNFAPVIRAAIDIVKLNRSYHILLIVADGQVNNELETKNAIVEASKYALSIIMIGVGDGPWKMMEKFDDDIPNRIFDNFQFVPFSETMHNAENPEVNFSVASLMEIPDQYAAIKHLGYLG